MSITIDNLNAFKFMAIKAIKTIRYDGDDDSAKYYIAACNAISMVLADRCNWLQGAYVTVKLAGLRRFVAEKKHQSIISKESCSIEKLIDELTQECNIKHTRQ